MANGKFQKATNNILILQKLREGFLSRRVIADELSLQPSTVTYAIARLIELGLVEEKGEDLSIKMGRRRTLVGINSNYGCVFGIELLVNHFHATITDFSGNVVFHITEKYNDEIIPFEKGSVQRFEYIVDYVLKKLEKNCTNKILGACIAIAGIVDQKGEKILFSWTQGLYNYYTCNLTDKYSYNIFFENDANCAAFNHLGISDDTFIYTLIQMYKTKEVPSGVPPVGVGMGVVIDGRLRRGYTSHAGEFKSVLYHGRDFNRQLSISNEELANIENDEALLKQFFKEIVDNLRFAHSLLDPRIIYVGGYLTKWENLLIDVISNSQIENESDCFTIASSYEDDICEGASKLVLEQLFNLPTVESRLKGWDANISPIAIDK